MCIPISQGQCGSWDSSMAAMGFTIGEAPRIPTNIPPEPKNMEESPPPKKNEKKKCGFRRILQSSASKVLIIIAIFFMQLLANGCLLFVDFDRMCTLLGDLLGKSLLFKVMGPPALKFAAEIDRCSKNMIWLWVWIHVNLVNITWFSTINSFTHGNRRLPPPQCHPASQGNKALLTTIIP